MKLSKLERIKTGIRQQWRMSVLKSDVNGIITILNETVKMLFLFLYAILVLIAAPFVLFWEYGIGIIFVSLTAKEEEIQAMAEWQKHWRKGQ